MTDDDADNQSGDNRSDCRVISPDHSAAAEFLNRLSAPARTDHNQRPAVKPRYCNWSIATADITTINHR